MEKCLLLKFAFEIKGDSFWDIQKTMVKCEYNLKDETLLNRRARHFLTFFHGLISCIHAEDWLR